MDDQTTDNPAENAPVRQVRLPPSRWAALLAAAMLGIGIVVGAALGPAPQASLGDTTGIAQRLPLLLAAIERGAKAREAASAASTQPPAVTPQATPAAAKKKSASRASSGSSESSAKEEASEKTEGKAKTKTKKLPAITNVWLIELAGGTFEAALAQQSAAPYIDGQLLGTGTLLSGWSALDASAFATDAALAEPPAAGSTPPLLHSIVQPPCPEGAAGAACAAETPGQLTAADEFLKATLATIVNGTTYKEHGLVVVTFATVGIATQSELPPGASTATLTYQPPAGALLLSPFVKAGQRSTATFNTTSPRQSLEKLLR